MPAPSPAFIETDPPPLNSADFPFAVEEFPAETLATAALVIDRFAAAPAAPAAVNPHRYEE